MHSKSKSEGELKFEFEMVGPGAWFGELNTTGLEPGSHELIFQVDETTSLHASDQPLLLLRPDDYRKELMEEAEEEFMPSTGVWHCDQLERLMKSAIDRKLRDQGWDHFFFFGTSRAEGLGELPRPIATAPIHWILDALITEYLYLSTIETDLRDYWFFSIKEDILTMGFEIHFAKEISRGMREAVANEEFGDLHLLGAGGDIKKFAARTEFSDSAAHIRVQFGMYDGALQEFVR